MGYRYFTQADAAALANTYTLHIASDIRSLFDDFERRILASSRFRWIAARRDGGDWGTGSLLRWAVATVAARAFMISKPTDTSHPYHERTFLAPGADLLNHSPNSRVAWVLRPLAADVPGDLFQIFNKDAYASAAQEVFNHYQVRWAPGMAG